ncbi:CBO0543 family protein [Bacillus sp. J33]|uniref:CBO0543 family protein n=1 Tax=Bacillus sp. J33 TaxID=935836 RepID=UPI00047C58B0|nr:CBO0543 family protein [Bacillus sp. J33]
MMDRLIVISGIIFGIISFPSLFKKPSAKVWLPLIVTSGLVNYLFDKTLVKTGKVKYPVRLFPRLTKINIAYDFFVCTYLSIWYCQSTMNASLPEIVRKLIIFSLPQGIYEIILERKTNTLKFRESWKWLHSFFLVVVVKIISRSMLFLFLKKKDKDFNV